MSPRCVAVIADENAFLSKTLMCLRLAGIDSIVYDPATPPGLSRKILQNCSFVIVKGHSSNYRLMMKLKSISRAKIINHWMGTDVYNTIGNTNRLIRIRLAQLFVSQNWVVGKRLLSPLKSMRIVSKIVPHRVVHRNELKPKLRTKGILVYNPESSARQIDPYLVYGIDKAVELSGRLPDYTFHLVGGGKVPLGFRSYVSHGYLNGLESIWDKVDFYLRVTLSDGMPGIILEAAENGILSISDYPYFEGIILYTNPDEIAGRIRFCSSEDYKEALEAMIRDIMSTYSREAVVNAYRSSLALD